MNIVKSISVLVILVWFGYAWIIPLIYSDSTGLTPGTYGDMFGGLNTMFSGLAFVGIIATIYMQNEEMNHSRKNTEYNRVLDIIYKQIERVEKSVNEFEVSDGTTKHKGFSAFIYLENLHMPDPVERFGGLTEQEAHDFGKAICNKKLEILWPYRKSFEILSVTIFNSTKIVNSILERSDLSEKDINDLKELFIANFGIYVILPISTYVSTIKDAIKYYGGNDYLHKYNRLELTRTARALEPFLNLHRSTIPKDIIDRYKRK
ncbi:MAG: hypothetical protein WC716_02305 [Chitinophagaceae bacterium]